jgi:hypothetical protein
MSTPYIEVRKPFEEKHIAILDMYMCCAQSGSQNYMALKVFNF